MATKPVVQINEEYEQLYGFKMPERFVFKAKQGLTQDVVKEISWMKGEPEWMTAFRLRALDHFLAKPLPAWADLELLEKIQFDAIYYYLKPTKQQSDNWEDVPEDIKKTFDRLGIPEAERKFLAGVSAQYECLTGDTRVLANPTAKPIKDIEPGIYVYSLNETTKQLEKQRVKRLMLKGKRQVHEVVVAGRTIKATSNHPLLALTYTKPPGRQRGRFGTRWMHLSDLKVGDYVALAKELPDEGKPYGLPEVSFESTYQGRNQLGVFPVSTERLLRRQQPTLTAPQETTEAFMWFLGLYLGDGYMTRDRRGALKRIVNVAIPASDSPLRKHLQQVLKDVFGYSVKFGRERYRVRVHALPIVKLLERLGLDQDAHTKRVPVWAFGLPKNQKLALLAGFIDADGYVRKTKLNNDVSMTSCNRALLSDLHLLAITCGFRASQIHAFESTMTYKGKTTTRTAYRMYLYGDLSSFKPYSVRCARDVVARRWYQRYSGAFGSPINAHTSNHLGFAKIQSIRPLGVEPVYDIEVEGYHNFVAEGLIVHNSESVYHSMHEDLTRQGVIFLDMDTALKEQPEIVKEYFATVIPPADNKFAALNSAVWSGGSFIYVPKGVHVEMPLQAYFRINAERMGQFERTLIITDEGASVHYIEGCLPAGEQISTGKRWVNIESVRPGDGVLNSDGKEATVRAVRVRPFKGEMVTIHPLSVGNTFQVTTEHPVLAIPREEARTTRKVRKSWLSEVDTNRLLAVEPRFIEAGRLHRGDFLVFPISQVVRDDPRYTIPALRLLGYYLAEGSTFVHRTLRQPVVVFSFGAAESERPYIEEVKGLIQEATGKRAIEVANRKNHGISVLVYSQKLRELCLESCGKGASAKELSKTVMELPPDKQAHLLETYFFGDGSRYQRAHTMVRASTASLTLARQLQELLARQGYYATISLRKGGKDTIQGRRITRKDQYILYYSPDKTMGEVRRRGDTFLVPIKKLQRIPYEGPVFNIELDRTPNAYLARGFAVHNCTAPVYSSDSLHSAVVELIAKPHSKLRYTTIQNWSKNIYNLVTKRAVAYEGATVQWLDGNLGCVRAGELVYTEHGPRPIETIEPGVRVWSFEEVKQEWVLRPVAARKDSGLQPVYEVIFSNGRTIHVTGNHPLLSVQHDGSRPKKLGRYSLRWTPLCQLTVGGHVLFPTALPNQDVEQVFAKPSLSPTFIGRNQYGASYKVATHARLPVNLPLQADEDICWMLGLWLADGDSAVMNGVSGGPRYGRVGWSVPRQDRARKRLMRLLHRYTKRARIEERKDGHYFRINSVELALWLGANGLVNGSRQKRVPGWVFTLPRPMQLAFLAGYLDGDGYARRSELVAKSANRELLRDVQMLSTLCGIHAGAVHTEETIQDFGGKSKPKAYITYHLAFSSGVQALRSFLSAALRSRLEAVSRSHHYQLVNGHRPARLLQGAVGVARILAIRPAGVAQTYDLEIEGTRCFVVNGILVHNSKLTMKFPGVYMMGRGAHGEVLSVAFAGSGQHQDAGAKMIHAAPDTHSVITSKSISKGGGRASYRGLVKVHKGAEHSKSTVRCDALLLDEASRSDTYPTMDIDEQRVSIGHEATVSKIGDEQLFYLMSRGLSEQEAMTMVVNGFIEPFVKELPLEYAVELNRLVQLEMEGAVG